jgi:hypothetical protein
MIEDMGSRSVLRLGGSAVATSPFFVVGHAVADTSLIVNGRSDGHGGIARSSVPLP